ncbi:hypothetical protein F5Y08DRAFT_307622 [Xylaria arbuscula]|nr:hypothetical protein F5Y08DRAFT_307622 [Xylaria arbuscula]
MSLSSEMSSISGMLGAVALLGVEGVDGVGDLVTMSSISGMLGAVTLLGVEGVDGVGDLLVTMSLVTWVSSLAGAGTCGSLGGEVWGMKRVRSLGIRADSARLAAVSRSVVLFERRFLQSFGFSGDTSSGDFGS